MSKFLDMMLRPEAEDVQRNLPTARYEIKRLSRVLGQPELEPLYWLFCCKDVMPWTAYEYLRRPGYRDLAWAFASMEGEARTEK